MYTLDLRCQETCKMSEIIEYVPIPGTEDT